MNRSTRRGSLPKQPASVDEEEGMGRRTRDTQMVACASCGAQDAIQIEITLPDDSDVTFNSCHRCEYRWWNSDGKTIDLTAVLEKSRKGAER